jgi:hypothetical protein
MNKEEKEIFREIDGFPDYEISNIGRVCSFKGKYPRIIKPRKNQCGYLTVGICTGGKQVTKGVHRLVAKAFVPNPKNKPQVNHIDEDKLNNVAENLEWVTPRENCNHGTRNKRMAETQGKTVVQYTTDGVFLAEYPSTHEAERVTGISQADISKACRGKLKTAGGYIWLYEEGGETC